MNYESATSVLNEHLRLVDQAEQTPWLTRDRKTAVEALNAHSQAVNAVLRQLGLGSIGGTTLSWHRNARGRIERAVQILAARREMAETASQLGGPALPLNLLHPVVAAAAWHLWAKGYYRHAVADAATAVNDFTQKKVGRYDITDKDLLAQVFSDKEPEKDKPRLRCPGKRSSATVRSMQQGALQFCPVPRSAAACEGHRSATVAIRWPSRWRARCRRGPHRPHAGRAVRRPAARIAEQATESPLQSGSVPRHCLKGKDACRLRH